MYFRKRTMVVFFTSIFILMMLILTTSIASKADDSPTVVFQSPTGANIPIDSDIEVIFSELMLQDDTEDAFSIDPYVAGEFSWNKERLTFDPDSNLQNNKEYKITISTEAKNLDGISLDQNSSFSFTTVKVENNGGNNNNGGKEDWWYTWEPIVTMLTVIGTVIVGLVGVWGLRRKKSQLSRYIEKLDGTYHKYKHDGPLCEQKLTYLKESLKAKVKKGEVEEYHYLILDKKIDDYLHDIKYKRPSSKPKIVKIFDKSEPTSDIKAKGGPQKAPLDQRPQRPERPESPPPKPKEEPTQEPKKPPKPRIIEGSN